MNVTAVIIIIKKLFFISFSPKDHAPLFYISPIKKNTSLERSLGGGNSEVFPVRVSVGFLSHEC